MTIVVWDGETLAADRLSTSAFVGMQHQKLHEFTLDGVKHFAAYAGVVGQAHALFDWVATGKPEATKPTVEDAVLIVVNSATKEATLYEDTTFGAPAYGFMAFGASTHVGAAHALKRMGLSARQIVEKLVAWEEFSAAGVGVDSISFI